MNTGLSICDAVAEFAFRTSVIGLGRSLREYRFLFDAQVLAELQRLTESPDDWLSVLKNALRLTESISQIEQDGAAVFYRVPDGALTPFALSIDANPVTGETSERSVLVPLRTRLRLAALRRVHGLTDDQLVNSALKTYLDLIRQVGDHQAEFFTVRPLQVFVPEDVGE